MHFISTPIFANYPIMTYESSQQPNNDIESCMPTGKLSDNDIERLGRQRPDAFPTAFAEIGFCFSLLASMFMAVGTPSLGFRVVNDDIRNTLSVVSA
jgi:hypothetical protein